MILDLTENDDKYIVINIDEITGIEGFADEPLFSFQAPNGEEVTPQVRLRIILSVCLADEDHFPATKVYNTNHAEYFSNYLRYYDNAGFFVKTIVLEKQYMNLSYLKDFSKYYSVGYNSYDKFCKRVHFFQTDFNKNQFQEFISSRDGENEELIKRIKTHYLGNIVAKPLPFSLIGSTLIRSYDEFFDSLSKDHISKEYSQDYLKRNRTYSALCDQRINLFGQTIDFKSLVFQEQDSAVSACATVAIWVSLHKLNELFGTPILAPSEITELAGLGVRSGRSFPNKGLDLDQIIKAIDRVQNNLVSEIFTAQLVEKVAINRQIVPLKILQPWKIKRIAYAYLKLQIPFLLGYAFCKRPGNHLVTITGYRFEKNESERVQFLEGGRESTESMIGSVADRIVRLYAHDDQLGPFSKIGFDNNGFENYLKVNWRGKAKFELAVGQILAVPIIDFIKLNYPDIEKFATLYQEFLDALLVGDTSSYFGDKGAFIWDIYIIQSNEYKSSIRNSDDVLDKEIIQLQSLPQYIWIAGLRYQNKDVEINLYDFIFDATDTPTSMSLVNVVYFNESVKKQLVALLEIWSETTLRKLHMDFFEGIPFLEKIKDTLGLK